MPDDEVKIGDLWRPGGEDQPAMICENLTVTTTSHSNAYWCNEQPEEVQEPTWVRWNVDGADDQPYNVLYAIIRPWVICRAQLDVTRDMLAKLGIEELTADEVRHYNMLIHSIAYVIENMRLDMDAATARKALLRLRSGNYIFYDEEIAEQLFDQLMHPSRWVEMFSEPMGVVGHTGPTGAESSPPDHTGSDPRWIVEPSSTADADWTYNGTAKGEYDSGYYVRDSPTPHNFAVASDGEMCDYRASMWNVR